jgi:hypothetical protein
MQQFDVQEAKQKPSNWPFPTKEKPAVPLSKYEYKVQEEAPSLYPNQEECLF